MTDGEKILKYAVEALTTQLNDLLEACTDSQGQIQAPSKKVYMQSRGALPSQYSMTLKPTPKPKS